MLRRFYFDHEGLFVIPIEHLGPEGMDAAFADELRQRGRSDAWIALFDEAFSHYWTRATELFAKAPETWFPPRRQHVCIVTDPDRVRPYSQPIQGSSWLLYECDFDPERSGLELATYLFFHTERYGLAENILASAVHNLAYFQVRSRDEIEAFVGDCAKSERPDAASFRAMADGMPWIRRLYHARLRRPTIVLNEQLGKLDAADLLVPMSLQPEVKKLAQTFKDEAQGAMAGYFARYAPNPSEERHRDALVDWLKTASPRALVVTEGGKILWDPDEPANVDAVAEAASGIAEACAESMRQDLEVIGSHSAAFLDALTDPSALPDPHELDQEAGTYIHESRKLIAYDLRHPVLNRLREPALPLERWMLGARTIHEWGHLAVDGDVVTVDPDRLLDFAQGQAAAGSVIDGIIGEASPTLQDVAKGEGKLLEGEGTVGEKLFRALMGRMEDFQANVLARRFLEAEEMETYARANVISLAKEHSVGPWMRLVRHAYEYQYLRLGSLTDPFDYFVGSVWFGTHYVDPGVVTLERMLELVDAVSRVCNCYAIDEDAFKPGALPPGR